MNETEIIQKIRDVFPVNIRQQNKPFECDAEILNMGNKLWALTMDDFSPEEDLFTAEDPVRLGSNLATATLSDLLACGAEPRFFMQALSLPRTVDPEFLEGLSEGIRRVLSQADCSLCGGDMGSAEPWRYCGFAMGPVPSGKPLTHRLPRIAQSLYVTGTLGDANLSALCETPTPAFEFRGPEAKNIRNSATGCIDTSGGFLNAVWLLHEINPELRFELHLDQLPMADGVDAFCRKNRIPPEAALLGGAGEYELLFTAASDAEKEAVTEIGSVQTDEQSGIYFYRSGEAIGAMESPPPDPRDTGTAQEHAQAVIGMATRLFGT